MLYVLIPSHNNKHEVMEVLACLQRQSTKDLAVVLVDDGSTDGTHQAVMESFPDTVILHGDGNLWWTGANVLGVDYILQQAKEDDAVLLLNNDLILKEDYIDILLEAKRAHQHALIGSTMVDHERPDFIESGIRFDHALKLTVTRDVQLIESTDFDFDVGALPGRGTLVPVSVFREVGNFDAERLPHYGADYEFSIRARRAGYRLLVSHRACVFAKTNITGIEVPQKAFISLKECADLLFSKKSKTHLIYYLNYVWLCSERPCRVRNVINSALGTLYHTLLKTRPFFPIKVLLSLLYRTIRLGGALPPILYRFLCKGYPLRARDMAKYGLEPAILLEQDLVYEKSFRGEVYYYFYPELNTRDLSEDQVRTVLQLRGQSFNYRHKINIVLQKLSLLFSHEATP